MVELTAWWRISRPLAYVDTLGTYEQACAKLDSTLPSAMEAHAGQSTLAQLVRTSPALKTLAGGQGNDIPAPLAVNTGPIPGGRDAIMRAVRADASKGLEGLGIELAGVGIQRLSYGQRVEGLVFQRMIAERKARAEALRAEGEGRKAEIAGLMEKELQILRSEAFKTSEEIRGKADAEAALQELWRDFKATGDPQLRERLILHYSPLVKYIAGRISANLPQSVEQADLVTEMREIKHPFRQGIKARRTRNEGRVRALKKLREEMPRLGFEPLTPDDSKSALISFASLENALGLQGVATISADPVQMIQLFQNLIGNAVKFTTQGGIALRVGASKGENLGLRLRMEVEDTGFGIAPEGLHEAHAARQRTHVRADVPHRVREETRAGSAEKRSAPQGNPPPGEEQLAGDLEPSQPPGHLRR